MMDVTLLMALRWQVRYLMTDSCHGRAAYGEATSRSHGKALQSTASQTLESSLPPSRKGVLPATCGAGNGAAASSLKVEPSPPAS